MPAEAALLAYTSSYLHVKVCLQSQQDSSEVLISFQRLLMRLISSGGIDFPVLTCSVKTDPLNVKQGRSLNRTHLLKKRYMWNFRSVILLCEPIFSEVALGILLGLPWNIWTFTFE